MRVHCYHISAHTFPAADRVVTLLQQKNIKAKPIQRCSTNVIWKKKLTSTQGTGNSIKGSKYFLPLSLTALQLRNLHLQLYNLPTNCPWSTWLTVHKGRSVDTQLQQAIQHSLPQHLSGYRPLGPSGLHSSTVVTGSKASLQAVTNRVAQHQHWGPYLCWQTGSRASVRELWLQCRLPVHWFTLTVREKVRSSEMLHRVLSNSTLELAPLKHEVWLDDLHKSLPA